MLIPQYRSGSTRSKSMRIHVNPDTQPCTASRNGTVLIQCGTVRYLFEGPAVLLVDKVLYELLVLLCERLVLRLVQLPDVPEGFVPRHTFDSTL
jgi:hypothetical protein